MNLYFWMQVIMSCTKFEFEHNSADSRSKDKLVHPKALSGSTGYSVADANITNHLHSKLMVHSCTLHVTRSPRSLNLTKHTFTPQYYTLASLEEMEMKYKRNTIHKTHSLELQCIQCGLGSCIYCLLRSAWGPRSMQR